MGDGISITTSGGITLAGISAAFGAVWRFLVVPLQKQIDDLKTGKADVGICSERHRRIDDSIQEMKCDLKEVKQGVNGIALLLATNRKEGQHGD